MRYDHAHLVGRCAGLQKGSAATSVAPIALHSGEPDAVRSVDHMVGVTLLVRPLLSPPQLLRGHADEPAMPELAVAVCTQVLQ